MKGVVGLATLLLASNACALIGPGCVGKQERGAVATLAGSVGGEELVMHRVAYDTRGSQNDARIDWDGQRAPDGARLHVYATRVGCQQFSLPAESNTGECQVLARAGWTPQGIATTLILTHGRGNPERLGTPPEYKLWVTSDRLTSYGISISFFFGPDC